MNISLASEAGGFGSWKSPAKFSSPGWGLSGFTPQVFSCPLSPPPNPPSVTCVVFYPTQELPAQLLRRGVAAVRSSGFRGTRKRTEKKPNPTTKAKASNKLIQQNFTLPAAFEKVGFGQDRRLCACSGTLIVKVLQRAFFFFFSPPTPFLLINAYFVRMDAFGKWMWKRYCRGGREKKVTVYRI